MTLAKSQKAIKEEKKIMSLKSITPFKIAEKWVKKLIEAIVLTTISGAHALKKSNTISSPLIVNKKQTVAETIKAITWFFVMAEIHEPIARNAPAIKKLPK